ncbi:UDP-N-acetylglucosamine transporter ROCK1-like [Magnolia sinica]|uniref:UDP-N-acetylglucosamine transporter ROCK1-like n=1 Tax=Magnolia sinica TaxID=86752 RepID=UPI0026587D57|nr:UDP-N-acetylglucosamine transporter ROCK1-like [Magnolia sinica]
MTTELSWHKQSVKQIGALCLLIIAAILLSFGEGSGRDSSGSNPDQVLFHGIIPVLVASVLSGLASSLCQWASQVRLLYIPPFSPFSFILSILFLLVYVKKHSSYLMSVEMSIVGSLCLLASMSKSPDGEAIR